MPILAPAELRELRARAHHLNPVVAVGHHGLTPAVLHELDLALTAHELIKVRVFNDERVEREAMLARVCAELDCAPVQHLGKLLIVWRSNPDKAAAKAKAKPATPAKAGGKAKAKPKRSGPRPPPDPVRERRRSTGTATGAGMVRRGAGRGQPVESVAREPVRGSRDDSRPPHAGGRKETGAGTPASRDARGFQGGRPSGPASRFKPREYDGRQREDGARSSPPAARKRSGATDDAPRDRYAAKAPRSTGGAREYGAKPHGAKPRPISKRRPDADFEAAPPRDRFAGKPPRAMTTAGPRGYGTKAKSGARPPASGKSAGAAPRKPGGRPPRHDPLSSKPAPTRRRRTSK